MAVDGGPYEHSSPASSPDGRTLAVVADREPDWDLDETARIYLVDATGGGGGPRRLTRTGRHHTHPSWSPDGTRLATLASDDHMASPAHASPAVVDVATGREDVLATGVDRSPAPAPRSGTTGTCSCPARTVAGSTCTGSRPTAREPAPRRHC